ncbi:hypothetical protein GCM10007971_05300 [Oceanobacillus indicireducens]|uniref:Uncharacterized protein n=1 Tax=Oceanobacillus indicireducens TaxID=1004261 RepID=A0A917XSA4_9BACI|nr:hypothetical protein GCM10007971_05300 [Oceanobacillus indicireducens]
MYCDLHIDNHVPFGDALLEHDNVAVPFAPSSTIIRAAIINSVIALAIASLAEKGITPPVFLSGNVDGADEHNEQLMKKHKELFS